MIDPVTGQLLLTAGKFALDSYNANKRPRFKSSEMGRHYAKMKTQGLLGDANVRKMANQYGKFVNRGAEDVQSNYTGNLINKGLDNSISGIRGANTIGTDARNKTADYFAKLNMENELSKNEYKEKYAQMKTADREARYQDRVNARNTAMQGLSSAVMGGLNQDPKFMNLVENFDANNTNEIYAYLVDQGKSPDEILQILNTMFPPQTK